jgi:oxygen-dependent protoporphyrinogen oxidase
MLHDLVIIGAGIAGLAAAWELRQRGLEPLILEQGGRAGGVIITERTDDFVIDGGPDSMLVQKPAAVELCREIGLADHLLPTLPPRTAFVLRGGRLLSLPVASFLGLPTRLGPLVRSDLFSWRAKARMATEQWRPVVAAADESIGAFIRRRFGDEAVDYLAEPLLAGIHAGDVDQLSIHSLFPRLVQLEREHGSVLRGLRANASPHRSADGAFLSLPRGLAQLPETLVGALGDAAIRYHTRVEQISGTSPYKLTLDTDAAVHARAVIVATPAWAAARMFQSLDGPLARLCDEIPHASTATIACAFERDQVSHALSGTGFVVPRRERKTLTACTWVSSKWPGRAPRHRVLLRGFVGGATAPEVLSHSNDELTSKAVREMSSLLGITGDPVLARVFRWPRGTPQYNVGHSERVRAIEARLAELPGIHVTGSSYRGTGIPDCVADARATAAHIAATLHTSASRRCPG